MAIRKEEFEKMFERLNDDNKKSAIDFIEYLIHRQVKPSAWKEIEAEEPDDLALSEEEKAQLEADDEYISWEQAKNELQI